MTKIINIKHREPVEGVIAYCGLNFEYWAGIFPVMLEFVDLSVIGKPHACIVRGNRGVTIENYRRWLWKNIERPEVVDALRRIGSGEFDAIACWCKPLPCHCDVILSASEWIVSKGEVE